MQIKQNLVVLLIAVSVMTPAAAKVYKWVDAKGVTHYTSTPPPKAVKLKSKDVKEVKLHKTPKSSLTHKPTFLQAEPKISKTSKSKQSKHIKTKIKRFKKVARENKKKRDEAECRNMSSSEKENIVKGWEKLGERAVADGRETQEKFERIMTDFRQGAKDCKF
jgi:hypothetical protein